VLFSRVTLLESRLREREPGESKPTNAPVTNRITAPFAVVTASGRTLFAVVEQSSSTNARFSIGVSDKGNAAQLIMRDADGARVASMAQMADGRVGMGTLSPSGRFQTLLSMDPKSGPVLYLEGEDGKGLASIGTWGYALYNADHHIVATLGVGPHGGGVLELMDQSGVKMLEAGTTTEGQGIVRAGPLYKCGAYPMAMGLGLPDCIIGHKN
jgi:hypothetical protein